MGESRLDHHVLVYAPGARNGELITRRLRSGGIAAAAAATIDRFEEELLGHGLELSSVVVTHAALREGAGAAIDRFQAEEPDWSALPFVLLAPVLDAWLPPWRNTLVVAQPTTARVLVAAVRRAVDARRQQLTLARASDRLMRMAYRDPVTGLPNRAALMDRIGDLQRERRGPAGTFAALFLDLDAFKSINDRYGHAAGDEALRQVAAHLVSSVRAEDFVARWGGDEFIVLLVGPDAAQRVLDTAGRLTAGASVLLPDARDPVPIELSFGILDDVDAEASPDELLTVADARMYRHKRAKRRGGDRFGRGR